MSDRDSPRRVPSCTAGLGERVLRGFIAVIVAVFAVAFFPDSPAVGIAAGVAAVGIGVMAVTGFCPGDWVRTRTTAQAPAHMHGYPDARTVVTVHTTGKEQVR